MWEWIVSLTGWQWLAIASAIVLPLSALNAFLGLKSRCKDWRASKSKEGLIKRIQELKNLSYSVEAYKESPNKFYTAVLDRTIRPIMSITFAFLNFVLAFFTVLNLR